MTATTKLSELAPERTTDQLPSTSTESLLIEALASDDIDEVKAELRHVWGHYQSLEYFLSDTANIINAARLMMADSAVDNDLDPIELVARLSASEVIDQAYENAHSAIGFRNILGLEMPDAVRFIYNNGGPLPTAADTHPDNDEEDADILPLD